MPYTVPNQRIVTIHREPAKSDFLGIKNENWMTAGRDLGAHALMLYLYLASNANGYHLALSPSAIRQALGMPTSTYRDQFVKLLDRGYLVDAGGNQFDFYEIPQSRREIIKNMETGSDLKNVECASGAFGKELDAQSNTAENIEINNKKFPNDYKTNSSGCEMVVYIPKEIEVRVQVPKVERKKEVSPLERKEFVF